ncbi:MAG TPA: hypothetical protein VF126_03860, partial [Acidobacteriaceae bacterium]
VGPPELLTELAQGLSRIERMRRRNGAEREGRNACGEAQTDGAHRDEAGAREGMDCGQDTAAEQANQRDSSAGECLMGEPSGDALL